MAAAAATTSRRLLSTAAPLKFGLSSSHQFNKFGGCRQISQLVKPTSFCSWTSNHGFIPSSSFDVDVADPLKFRFSGSINSDHYYNKFDCRQNSQLANKQQPDRETALLLTHTVELARVLKAKGVEWKQIDAAFEAIIQALTDNLETTVAAKSKSDVSNLEMPKIEMLEEADFSKSKSELIKMLQEANQSKFNSEVQRYLLERESECMKLLGRECMTLLGREFGSNNGKAKWYQGKIEWVKNLHLVLKTIFYIIVIFSITGGGVMSEVFAKKKQFKENSNMITGVPTT